MHFPTGPALGNVRQAAAVQTAAPSACDEHSLAGAEFSCHLLWPRGDPMARQDEITVGPSHMGKLSAGKSQELRLSQFGAAPATLCSSSASSPHWPLAPVF